MFKNRLEKDTQFEAEKVRGSEAIMPKQFWVWKEHTCWVCQNTRPNGVVGPSYHAREHLPSSWEGHSPCTTEARRVWAEGRAHALRILQGKAEESPAVKPWWTK